MKISGAWASQRMSTPPTSGTGIATQMPRTPSPLRSEHPDETVGAAEQWASAVHHAARGLRSTIHARPSARSLSRWRLRRRDQGATAGCGRAHGTCAHIKVLTIPTASGTYCREVCASDLDEAVLRDAEHTASSENPDRGDAEHDGVLP